MDSRSRDHVIRSLKAERPDWNCRIKKKDEKRCPRQDRQKNSLGRIEPHIRFFRKRRNPADIQDDQCQER